MNKESHHKKSSGSHDRVAGVKDRIGLTTVIVRLERLAPITAKAQNTEPTRLGPMRNLGQWQVNHGDRMCAAKDQQWCKEPLRSG